MSGEEFAVIDGEGRPDGRKRQHKFKVLEGGAKKRRPDVLPFNLPPRLLSREQAAAYFGVSPTTFDQLVTDGIAPGPTRLRGRVLWDLRKLDAAIDALDTGRSSDDPFDRMAL